MCPAAGAEERHSGVDPAFHPQARRDDVLAIAPNAVNELTSYHWPGNVRELENCILGMLANCEGRVLDSRDIPKALRMALHGGQPGRRTPLEDAERAAIVAALEEGRRQHR